MAEMFKKLNDFADYAALFFVICLIPTGLDGGFIIPPIVSLSIIGGLVCFRLLGLGVRLWLPNMLKQ